MKASSASEVSRTSEGNASKRRLLASDGAERSLLFSAIDNTGPHYLADLIEAWS